nr:ComEC/Rec2 family competence protein [Chloroflexia bacterium]
MGRADGILIGASVLLGVLIGTPALVVVPTIGPLAQFLTGRVAVGRVFLCLLLAGLGAARAVPGGHTESGLSSVVAESDAAVGTVRSMPRAVSSGQRFLLDIERVRQGTRWVDTALIALVTTPDADLNTGDVVWVAWSLNHLEELPPAYADYVRSQGADITAYAFSVTVVEPGTSWLRPFVAAQRALTLSLRDAVPGDRGALLAGLVTGDDSDLSDQARAAFLATGTTHITAVSGSNLALVAGIWGAVAAGGSRRRRWWLVASVITTIWGYALSVGLEPPALRAAIVATLTSLSVRTGRRSDALTLVLLAAAIMAMVDPWMGRSLSFQLSVASSAALVSCLPRRAGAGVGAWLRGTLVGVVAAHFATLPLTILAFGTWSPLSIPANLAILPLVPPTFALAFLAGAVGLVWPALGALLATVAGVGAGWIVAIVSSLATLAMPVSLGGEGAPALVLIW